MTAKDIIHALGSDAKLSEALGLPLTTVNGWKRANFIPEWRREAVLRVAMAQGVSLSVTDFPAKEDRIPRAAA